MKKIFFLAFCLFIQPSITFSKPLPEGFADIISPLLPSVVSIASTTIIEEKKQEMPQFPEGSPFEDFFKEYFDQFENDNNKRPLVGLGSGFIIDEEGIVVTNNHVIEGADEIKIIMENGDEFEATVMGKDPKADLAVIKFEPKDVKLQSVQWGDSDSARVGDWAIAIGNPLGFGGTVTTGIISAIARDIGYGPYVKFIQTDASINRGNSGGPLFNVDGEVIGINSAIISQTGGSIGLGFAIPSNSAKKIVSQLKEFGRTKRGWLGVQIQGVTDEISESLGYDSNKGAFIASVQDNSPASKSGVEAGDIIIEFNNIVVETYRDLPRIVAETDVGTNVIVKIWRKNNIKDIKVKLGELEEDNYDSNLKETDDESIEIEEIGISVRDLKNNDYLNFDLEKNTTGVVVTEISNEEILTKVDDVIIEINREKVINSEQFLNSVLEIKEKGRSSILLRVIRDKKAIWVTLKYLKQ
tara:strand:+ start:2892 stop:4298 length:1407 start_codon:yes stop_codon:yes gene_type:complete